MLLISLIALLVAALSGTLPGQTGPTARISGRVMDAVTGRAIPSAVVRISYSPRRSEPERKRSLPQRSAVTGDNGTFSIAGVEPGEYSMWASKGGYLDTWYGATRPAGRFSRVSVQREALNDLVLRVWPAASIEGRVIDEANRPVAGAKVRVLPRDPGVFGSAMTDDRGMYRITRLPSGEYTVMVQCGVYSRTLDPTPFRSQRGGIDPELPFLLDPNRRNILLLYEPIPAPSRTGSRTLYVTSFFGGSTLAGARYFRLSWGETRAHLEIILRARPAVRVSGTIVGPSGPVSGAMLTLRPEGQPVDVFLQSIQAAAASDGTFSFVLVPTGRYTLTAFKRVPALTPVRIDDIGQPIVAWDDVIMSDEEALWLERPLTIGDRDITDLKLTLNDGVTVSGRVIFEGDDPASLPPNTGLLLSAEDKARFAYDSGFAPLTPVGSLRFKVYPGRRVLIGPGEPSGWSLKQVFLNGEEIGDGPITVPGTGSDGLRVVLTRERTTLSGVISPTPGRESQPVVVVFPADRRRWTLLEDDFQRARLIPVENGTFELNGLLAAEYFVAAVDDSVMAGWPREPLLERLQRVATRVSFMQTSSVHLSLTLRDRLP